MTEQRDCLERELAAKLMDLKKIDSFFRKATSSVEILREGNRIKFIGIYNTQEEAQKAFSKLYDLLLPIEDAPTFQLDMVQVEMIIEFPEAVITKFANEHEEYKIDTSVKNAADQVLDSQRENNPNRFDNPDNLN